MHWLPIRLTALLATAFCFPMHTNAASQLSDSERSTLFSPPQSSWPIALTIDGKNAIMRPTPENVLSRIRAIATDELHAEPITLRLKTTDAWQVFRGLSRDSVVKRYHSTPSKYLKLLGWVENEVGERIKNELFTIEHRDLRWIDPEKLANLLTHTTAKTSVLSKSWQDALNTPALTRALEQHFGDAWENTKKSVSSWQNSSPDNKHIPLQTFLPDHAQNLFGRYSYLRGRNCFSTALYFTNPKLVRDTAINVVKEPGHHRTMINSDEFLNALQLGFYEIIRSAEEPKLRYGDVIAFYDRSQSPSFLALKHAIVHIAGDVYFQKPSKSASSPIELAFWRDIVKVWIDQAEALDYAIYRRLPLDQGQFPTPQQAMERISWTTGSP